jgi:hypothetical protein
VDIADVMHQAMQAYEPILGNKALAIRAAIHAVEQQVIPNAAVDASSFDRDKLLSAALEVWTLYVGVSTSKLLPQELREQIPPLYSQEHEADPLVICKFFTPDSGWTWYAYEFDGLDTFFGYVVGQDQELGYFLLHKLETGKGPIGASIERDEHFTPTRLSEIRKLHGDAVVPIMIVLAQDEPEELEEEVLDDEEVKPFVITYVTRSDLQELGATDEQIAALTDEDMRAIANEMEELYVAKSFGEDLRETANKRLAQKGLAALSEEDDES